MGGLVFFGDVVKNKWMDVSWTYTFILKISNRLIISYDTNHIHRDIKVQRVEVMG
jgi:hypothetical protein